jgi:hypothetical protein
MSTSSGGAQVVDKGILLFIPRRLENRGRVPKREIILSMSGGLCILLQDFHQ